MLELYPSTVRLIRFCVNLVVRAALVAVTWGILLLIGLAFNWLIEYGLELAGAHESVRKTSTAVVLVFILALMAAALITSLYDIWAVAKAVLGDSSESDHTENQRDRD